jgi:hypothetical protein
MRRCTGDRRINIGTVFAKRAAVLAMAVSWAGAIYGLVVIWERAAVMVASALSGSTRGAMVDSPVGCW